MFNWYHGDFLTQGGREHEVAEPVFDEFVFHYKDKIEFGVEDFGMAPENLTETIVWAVFTNVDKDTYGYDMDEPLG